METDRPRESVDLSPNASRGLFFALGGVWAAHAFVVLGSSLRLAVFGSRALAWCCLTASVLAATVFARPSGPFLRARSAADSAIPRLWSALARALCFAAVALLIVLLVLAAAIPSFAYDVLGYRLPTIAQWMTAGRIEWVTSDDPVRNGYPLGLEAIAALLSAACGTPRLVGLPSLPLVVAGALAISFFARSQGVRQPLADASGALFVLAPMTLLNAPTGYVDAGFAGAVVCLVVLATAFGESDRPNPRLAVATGMAAALVLSIKGTGVAFAPTVVAAAVWRRSLRYKVSEHEWLGLALATLPGLFWTLRNLAHTGNPLWPVEIKVAGHVLFPGAGTMEAIMDSAHNTPARLKRLPEIARIFLVWLQPEGPATGFDDRLAGLGFSWPLFAVPAVAACLTTYLRKRGARAPLLFLFALCLLCFVLQPSRWWPRYVLWLWAPGALALAMVAEKLVRSGATKRWSLAFALLAVLTLGESAYAMCFVKRAIVSASSDVRRGTFQLRDFTSLEPASRRLASVNDAFWSLRWDEKRDVCRTEWRAGTDNALVDGIVAQFSHPPVVHILFDSRTSWNVIRQQACHAGCDHVFLLGNPPLLKSARRDPAVMLQPTALFDPAHIAHLRCGSIVAKSSAHLVHF